MATLLRPAGLDDRRSLVGLMREFYAEAGYRLVESRAGAAFEELLARPSLGRVWLAEKDGSAVGYIVVTFVFAMEHGGLAAVVDDFFVRPEARGEGLGKAALAAAVRDCESLGVRALRVEVAEHNAVAQAVYRSAGFELLPGHALMRLSLAEPSHET
jgi:ribosomal protein S18 acetylase RimI-like enzyme